MWFTQRAAVLLVSLVLPALGPAPVPTPAVILQGFASAPYPHPSRAAGYRHGDTFYDAATHYADDTVGIVVPAGYRPGDTVDYVVHFHGWSNHVAQVLARYRLVDQLQASGRNAILVVPQGPSDAQDSGDGKLELDQGGLARLLTDVTTFLRRRGITPASRIGRVAITAHSGGFAVASAVLVRGGLNDHIDDVVLFDATYGDLEGFANWATAAPGRRLVSLFTDALGTANVALMGLLQQGGATLSVRLDPNWTARDLAVRRPVFVLARTIPHDELLQTRDLFATALATSALAAR